MRKYTERFAKKINGMNIRLSICIPIYNCAEFVGQALDSILPQTSGEVEVIVYDGGSTDATPLLLKSYAREWPNFQYHRGAQRGGIDADRNTCFVAPGDVSGMISALEKYAGNHIQSNTSSHKWNGIAEQHMRVYRRSLKNG